MIARKKDKIRIKFPRLRPKKNKKIKGVEMMYRGIINDFYRNLKIDAYGNYILTIGYETCHPGVEDTPFAVKRGR